MQDSSDAVDVSVVIANYNTRALLECCLNSIYTHPPRRSFEVLVMDDASRDDSADMVRSRFPQARLFVNPVNLGYARSNNHAFAEARGRWVYMLNSDAELLPGLLDTLAEFLETHPDVGGVGSLLYNDDGSIQESVKALPSVRSAFVGKRSFLRRWLPRSWFTQSELLQWKTQDGEPFRAGYVSSASLMIPREVIREVGELDTRLWYFIDADYCKRIWNTGKSIYCVPAAKAIHREHRGGTLRGWRQRFWSLVSFHYGAYIYFRKHSGKPLWHPMYLMVILGLGGRFLASLVFQTLKELTSMDRRVYDRR
jgi:hypothetical protein